MDPAERFDARQADIAAAAPRLLGSLIQDERDWGDIFYEHSTYHHLTLRVRGATSPADPLQFNHSVVEGAGIRLVRSGSVGMAATTSLSQKALHKTAEQAVLSIDRPAQGGRHGEISLRPAEGSSSTPADAPDMISEQEKKALLREACDAALSWDERVKGVTAYYQDRTRRVMVIDTDGRMRIMASTMVGLRVQVLLSVDGQAVVAHAIGGCTAGFNHFLHHGPDSLSREAVERALLTAEAETAISGDMPVVLEAGWGGAWLHEAAGHLFEVDVRPPASIWQVDQQIAPEHVTLVDDGTLQDGRGSCAYDDEGTPSSRTPLVEAGRFRHFLVDRFHASRLNLPLTGNGRRQDYRFRPLPRMTNLVLEPGETAPEALVQSVKQGLYVRVIGSGRFDSEHRRFSFEVLEGYRIEDGRMTSPLSGVRVSGSCEGVLSGIKGVGNDSRLERARGLCEKNGQVVPISVAQPTVLVDGLTVGS